jgi:hypothetical protein
MDPQQAKILTILCVHIITCCAGCLQIASGNQYTLLYTSEVFQHFQKYFVNAKNVPVRFLQRNDRLYYAWVDLF